MEVEEAERGLAGPSPCPGLASACSGCWSQGLVLGPSCCWAEEGQAHRRPWTFLAMDQGHRKDGQCGSVSRVRREPPLQGPSARDPALGSSLTRPFHPQRALPVGPSSWTTASPGTGPRQPGVWRLPAGRMGWWCRESDRSPSPARDPELGLLQLLLSQTEAQGWPLCLQ